MLVLVRTFGAPKMVFIIQRRKNANSLYSPSVDFPSNRVRICLSNLTPEQNDKTKQQKTKAAIETSISTLHVAPSHRRGPCKSNQAFLSSNIRQELEKQSVIPIPNGNATCTMELCSSIAPSYVIIQKS